VSPVSVLVDDLVLPVGLPVQGSASAPAVPEAVSPESVVVGVRVQRAGWPVQGSAWDPALLEKPKAAASALQKLMAKQGA
jgi:hypothetical protein